MAAGIQRDAYASNPDGSDKGHIWDEPRELDGVNVTYELGSETAIPLQNDLPLPIATASLNKLVERVTDDKSHGAAPGPRQRARSHYSHSHRVALCRLLCVVRPGSCPVPLPGMDVCVWTDLNFLKMFLLTFQSFTTSDELFAKIVDR